MTYPIIPIHPARPALLIETPRLSGDAARVQHVVGALVLALNRQVGLRTPAGAWLRELRLAGGEAELSLAPGLPHCGAEVAQAAFEVLRQLLPDTDIYVRMAAR